MTARATCLPLLRLAAFAILAVFASAHWLALLADPPVGRAALALAVIAGAACVLAAIERSALGPWRVAGLAASAVGAATVAAALAVGLPASLLLPGGWDELGTGIDRGFAGLGGEVEFPYAGDEVWSRLVLLVGLVCLLALAAALAFWPRRAGGSGGRVAGPAVLVAVYAGAAAIRPGAESLLGGLVLLALLAAWLWLPELGRRAALVAGAAIVALGGLALPLAGAMEARPWVDYRDWRLPAPAEPRSYSWNHSYARLAPRRGIPLLEVRSNAPRYWRAAVLDRFDGRTWRRSAVDVGQPPLELPTEVDRGSPAGAPKRLNPEWVVRTEVELRGLRSEYVIAPGALRAAEGIELDPTPNGTTFADDGPLTEGDAYSTLSYAPAPSAVQMRSAPALYAPALAHHTTIGLPRGGGGPRSTVEVPLWGTGASDLAAAQAAARLTDSPYGEVQSLAERVTADAGTPYDAVKALEVYVRDNHEYVEDVAPRDLALRDFLFDSPVGYCEYFSGAMSLMLRTLGIPARVATGFTPGSRDAERPGRFQVRDIEAHSWTEVYFTGIGWVPFDPTPAAAPAQLQAGGSRTVSAAPTPSSEGSAARPATPAAVQPGATASGSSGSVAVWPFALALALPLAGGFAVAVGRLLRHRSLPAREAGEARAQEMAAALERLGWGSVPGTTLSAFEDRLRSARRPAAADYAAGLRSFRYANGNGRLPSLAQRRRMRRELPRLGGWEGRVEALRAVPFGAPRRRR